MYESNTSFTGQYRILNIIMLWLFVLTTMLILLPYTDVAPGLSSYIADNRTLLLVALIVSASNFISQFIAGSFSRVSQKKRNARLQQHLQQAVESLDFAERALLREFVLQRKSVLNLPVSEPTVRSLLDSGILIALGSPDEEDRMATVIAKAARPFITYRAIGLSRGKMSEETISQIMASRPEYARVKKPLPRAYRGVKAAA